MVISHHRDMETAMLDSSQVSGFPRRGAATAGLEGLRLSASDEFDLFLTCMAAGAFAAELPDPGWAESPPGDPGPDY
jgi:hypothetical protein